MLCDLIKEPSSKFQNFCRMSAADFEYLLCKIGPQIAKTDTNMRKCIPGKERFAVALRFQTTSSAFPLMTRAFRKSAVKRRKTRRRAEP
ncbi:hypothetical protein X777_15909 [Ooceraea biroi]|uniref:Uncharacterized protein n=1 Tax=Ooceraea biroi TaxID=2015173 RepID=A0A026WUC6_OOCBI|nr:hypothetical protein X777_15909 [Ooceraea biroi]